VPITDSKLTHPGFYEELKYAVRTFFSYHLREQLKPIYRPANQASSSYLLILLHGLYNTPYLFDKFLSFAREYHPLWFHSHHIYIPFCGQLHYGMNRYVFSVAENLRKINIPSDTPTIVIGHSMGGLVCRSFTQNHLDEFNIKGQITISTPHKGATIARLLPTTLGVDMRPGSNFLESLSANTSVPSVNIYTESDRLINPYSSLLWEAAENICLKGIDHGGSIMADSALEVIIAHLQKSTSAGQTQLESKT